LDSEFEIQELAIARQMLGVEELPGPLSERIWRTRFLLNRIRGDQNIGWDTLAMICEPFFKEDSLDDDAGDEESGVLATITGMLARDEPVYLLCKSLDKAGMFVGQHGEKLKVKFEDDNKEFRLFDEADVEVVS